MDYVMRRRSTVCGALEMFSLPLPLYKATANTILCITTLLRRLLTSRIFLCEDSNVQV